MPASDIFLIILVSTLVALALFAAYQINVREERIAELEVELAMQTRWRNEALARVRSRNERLFRGYRAEYDRANDAEARTLDRNIFDELADEYAWLKFPAEPGASASAYHFIEAELYDAALNSHEVK